MKHSGTPGRMPQGLQRMPQSQTMNRSFQAKQQQQHVGHLSRESIKQELKQEAVEESESEMDREERLENWNRRLLQVCITNNKVPLQSKNEGKFNNIAFKPSHVINIKRAMV